MKKAKENRNEPTSDERFKRASLNLDRQIAFQKEMKAILNAEQFETYKKMEARKRLGARKKMMVMKRNKKLRESEENKD